MTKSNVDLSNNQAIYEAIQKIARHGLVNKSTGAIRDSERVTGYVAKIHMEGDLVGTIDVQEYVGLSISGDKDKKIGYHEGVYLSALQDNLKGMVVIPKLFSEVTIVRDPESKTEYVSMFSHVDFIQLDSHERVVVGVTEREEYDEKDEDTPDIPELAETGVHARTTYLKDSVVTEVQGEAKEDKVAHVIDDKKFQIVAGNNKSSQTISKEKIEFQHNKASVTLEDDKVVIAFGSSSMTIKDGVVYVGSESGTDDAVLGGALADILMDIVNAIAQIKTTTQLGPQPPLNAAQFVALKSKINSFKSSHSGFLTKNVQIQK